MLNWPSPTPGQIGRNANPMTRNEGCAFGWPWVDSLLPAAIGASCGLAVILEGGPLWTLLVVAALCWGIWQLALRLGGRLGVRIALVTSLAVATLICFFLFSGVDTARLYQAVVDAGIGVNTVSSDRKMIVVSIQPVSWGPERNRALRAVFAAAHTYAKSQKRVSIQWGDAMITSIEMKDIEEFTAGRVTYRELLNRMDWSGTPNVLPDDSNNRDANHQATRVTPSWPASPMFDSPLISLARMSWMLRPSRTSLKYQLPSTVSPYRQAPTSLSPLMTSFL